MNSDEFAFFNQQLAAMLREGIPLEGALKQLCAGMRTGPLRGEIQALEDDLARGIPLKEAMARRELPDLYRCLSSAPKATTFPACSPCWPTITNAATTSGPGSKG